MLTQVGIRKHTRTNYANLRENVIGLKERNIALHKICMKPGAPYESRKTPYL